MYFCSERHIVTNPPLRSNKFEVRTKHAHGSIMRDKLLIAAGSALILLGISGVVFEVLFRSSRKDTENMIYANSGQWANYSLDAYNTSVRF